MLPLAKWICGAGMLTIVLPLVHTAHATSIAPVKLEDLFAQADDVAVVKILSGDSEHYPTAVYKAVVKNGYKGMTAGQTIFFGPFESYRIGNEYLLFLKKGTPASPKGTDGFNYGPLQSISTIMYAGYAALEVGYECVFAGKDISQRCDDSIQVNPEQVILPSLLKTFPEGDATAVTNYKKWVRKEELLLLLQRISKATKVPQTPNGGSSLLISVPPPDAQRPRRSEADAKLKPPGN